VHRRGTTAAGSGAPGRERGRVPSAVPWHSGRSRRLASARWMVSARHLPIRGREEPAPRTSASRQGRVVRASPPSVHLPRDREFR
jgi:hypothetical protein